MTVLWAIAWRDEGLVTILEVGKESDQRKTRKLAGISEHALIPKSEPIKEQKRVHQ